MKRRSLSLFLALLMVFGSVLPVFATEPAAEAVAEEEQTPALTYEDLYVADGLVFAWDAFDKTAEDTVDFGDESSIVLAEQGGAQLILTKPSNGTAVYGDGYLEVADQGDAQLKLTNVYTNVPATEGEAYSYTTQATMALLPYQGETTPIGFSAHVLAYAHKWAVAGWTTYSILENINFIDDADIALHDAWSQAYLAAKNDESLQASFRTPISKSHYETLAADETYASHVFVVDGTDEDATNNPCADYSITGYEADWTAFAYIMADSTMSSSYVISYNTTNRENFFAGGVAKTTVVVGGQWAGDRDWKNAVRIWTAKAEYETATQTRVSSVTKTASGYTTEATMYVDQTSALSSTKNGTAAPGANMTFAYGLDARFYGLRIYDRALTETEMKQNHLADLCGYYDVDLTKLASVMQEDENIVSTVMNDLYDGAASLSIGETTADAVTALIDEAEASVAAAKLAIAYGQMYVADGLMYRWDAYDLDAIDGTTLSMYDKNGGDTVLSLSDVTYNSTYKVPETTNPIDFSALITRDADLKYVESALEFELVMVQTSYTGSGTSYTRPYIILGPMNTTGSGSKVTGWASGNYSFGGYSAFYIGSRANATETVTYYFDADGNKVDAAVDGGYTVDVPYLKASTTSQQLAMQEGWATVNRFFGNYVGQSYALGAAISFTLPENSNAGTMALNLYRDGLATLTNGGGLTANSVKNISYVPGKAATATVTKIVPETYEEALQMAAQDVTLNTTYAGTDGGLFKIGGSQSSELKVGYHAFRLYNRHLTDAERQQNHFADLCNYHQIDNIYDYLALSDAHKAAIYTQTQFHEAMENSQADATNTSFEDVTKEELEAAIDAQIAIAEAEKAEAERIAKYEKIAEMYVSGATTFWSAFGANEEGVGVLTSGTALTVSGGTSAYADGYLRAVGSTLTATGAYTTPADGETVNYTTELIYATYDDGAALDGYTGSAKFKTEYGVIFGQKVSSTFLTLATKEDITYTDNAGRAMQEAWASAYVAASNDATLQASFWTPISETDYNSMIAIEEQAANVRQVGGDTGIDPVGTYSQTGYEANWDGFQYVISSSGLNRKNYYHGYNYCEATKPGIGNSNIMKSDTNVSGKWAANLDFDNWGEKGNFSRHDFGVVTSHTWIDTVTYDTTATNAYTAVSKGYSDDVLKTNSTRNGSTYNTAFKAYAFDADYYAIRIYPFALTDAQRAQNHFADLCSYYAIDNAEAFLALQDGSKSALYTDYASTLMADTTKADLEAAITAAATREEVLATISAENYVTFEGYQVRMYEYAGLRSVYEVNKNASVENVTLVEVGAIMAIADGRTVADLTVEKTEEGYAATGAMMANTAVYTNGAWDESTEDGDGAIFEKDGKTTFAYTCTFATEAEMTAEKVQTELIFRGYVVVAIDGVEFVLYTNMTSETFGDTISMYEASKNAAFADYDTSKAVAALVDGAAE